MDASVETALQTIQAARKAKKAAELELPPESLVAENLEVRDCAFLRFQDKGCKIGIKVWNYATLTTLAGMSAASKSGELLCSRIAKVSDGFIVFASHLESGRAWVSNIAVESAIPVV